MSPRLLSFLPDSGEGRGGRGWVGAFGVFSLYGMCACDSPAGFAVPFEGVFFVGTVTAFNSVSPGLRKRQVGYMHGVVHTISRSCAKALNWRFFGAGSYALYCRVALGGE